MSIKKAVDQDVSADRPNRPTPSHRDPVEYNCVEAHGVTNPDTTKPQYHRVHELAASKEAKSQGAIVTGKVGDGCVKAADPTADAEARFQSIHKRRKETEKAFDALRPTVAGTRKRLGR
jgi:hypothetical protein